MVKTKSSKVAVCRSNSSGFKARGPHSPVFARNQRKGLRPVPTMCKEAGQDVGGRKEYLTKPFSKWTEEEKSSTDCNLEVHHPRHEMHFMIPRLPVEWMVKKDIDWPIAHLLINATLVIQPLAAFAWWTNSHLAGIFYLLVVLTQFHGRLILMMHYATHCNAFKGHWQTWACHVMPAFIGLPPGLYRAHHCLMHHGEGNIHPKDLSSTEPYQRDKLSHFIHYWLRFAVGIWVELPIYAFMKGEVKLGLQVTASALAYVALVQQLWVNNQIGLLYVFGLYMPINSFLLMFGNWGQHIFINPECPKSPYGYTYNILNSPPNLEILNDGFHIEHHLNSIKHWASFPSSFQKNLPKYKEHDALLFHSLDFFGVSFLVLSGQMERLEKYRLSEKATWPLRVSLKDRLKPIHHQEKKLA